MEIPKEIVEKMEVMERQLGHDFSQIWTLLPICPERDKIMLHVLHAKTLLQDYIEEVNE